MTFVSEKPALATIPSTNVVLLPEQGGSLQPALQLSTTTSRAEAAATQTWRSEPKLYEVLLLSSMCALLFVTTICHFRDYGSLVRNFGDSGAYVSAASAIRHADFRALDIKQFCGYSYAMAVFSIVTGIPVSASLLFVSFLCSLLALAVSFRLWGGWVTALFAISNFDWMQRSLLGGAEPLFVVLLFGSFWLVRQQRWVFASLLAGLATVTRPLGVFALIAIGLVLLRKRNYRTLIYCITAAIGVGTLYVLPYWIYFGDPLYQVHLYRTNDWHSQGAIGWPLYAIGQSLLHNQQPWTNVVLTGTWILFAVVTFVVLAIRTPQAMSQTRTEWMFALLYTGFLFCYSSPEWARAEFPRFVVPTLPLLLLAISNWLPRDRRVLWAMAVFSSVLAAASALGIRHVIAALHAT